MNKTLAMAAMALTASTAMSGLSIEVREIKSQEPQPTPPADPVRRGERMSIDRAMEATGSKSPSEALRKAKQKNANYGYLPHVGAKQRAKALKRLAAAG